MMILSNLSMAEMVLCCIFGANIFLWTYVLRLSNRNLIPLAGIAPSEVKAEEASKVYMLEAPLAPLLLAAPREKNLIASEMPDFIEHYNESYEVVAYEEYLYDTSSKVSGMDIEILEDPKTELSSSGVTKIPEVERLYMSELADSFGLRILDPQVIQGRMSVSFFDDLVGNPKESQSMLILTKLEGEIDSFRNLKLEPFYDGVDVVTNFTRGLFMCREDVFSMLRAYADKYREIVLIAKIDEAWSFETLDSPSAVAIDSSLM